MNDYKMLKKYTAKSLAELADSMPDKITIIRYRESGGYYASGKLLTAYTSLSGNDCAKITSFANSIPCELITGHMFID